MTWEARLISFASSASSSKGAPRSKENGPYVSLDWAIDETLERLRKLGAQLAGEVAQYKDAYRLCYIRGPEGLLPGLARELS